MDKQISLFEKVPLEVLFIIFFLVIIFLTIVLIKRNMILNTSNQNLLVVNNEIKKSSKKLDTLNKKLNRELKNRKIVEKEIKELNCELENRVKKRTSQLENVNKELEAFAYSVSHDLRTPLRHIDGFSQAIIEDYSDDLDSIAKDFLGRIHRASQRMSNLIDSLLDLSRITRSKLYRREINLGRMAKNIVKDIAKMDKNRKVTFKIDANIMVSGDERLLEIALYNLFSNAWKFTSKIESAVIEFGKLGIKEKEKYQDFTSDIFFLRDNGAGFNMKYVDKLFIAFNRLHKTKDFPGTGIGLATVYRIINRHGGKIWAEAEVNRGTTFYFTIS